MPPKRYRHLSLREEVFKRLEEFAKSKGLTSLSDAIALLLDYADIYSKLEYLLQTRVYTPSGSKSDLPQAGVYTPDKSSSGTTSNPSTAQVRTVVKCYEKSKMKYPVESNIAYFRSKGLLVDWWEEGDNKVCFELKKSEDKKQQRKEQEDDSWLLQYID